uniref:Uncharacterized protein n=1 Tax=Arundo donax TaxID=35708 RepID=A0A0A9GL00_ARUDO
MAGCTSYLLPRLSRHGRPVLYLPPPSVMQVFALRLKEARKYLATVVPPLSHRVLCSPSSASSPPFSPPC